MINIGIGIGWAKALYSVANNVIANFKARVLSYPNSIFEAGPCLDATLEELNAIGLLDNASLVITPNAYTEGILYDVVPNTTLGDMNVVRATTATRVNSAGLIEVVPRNLFTYSEQFTNADWSKVDTTITANQPDPFGGNRATLVQFGTAASSLINQSLNLTSGTTYTLSVYIKGINLTDLRMIVAGNSSVSVISQIINGVWVRVTLTGIAGSTAFLNNQIARTTSALGQSFYIYGAQLESFPTATEYFPTTTRLNIPRIDYTNGSCPSLLVEPQRTNLLTYSNTFSNAAWIKLNCSVASNSIISPDGTQNSTTLTSSVTNNNFLYNAITTANGLYTLSCFVKYLDTNTVNLSMTDFATGSASAEFNFNTGLFNTPIVSGSWTNTTTNVITLTNGWFKISITSQKNAGLSVSSRIDGFAVGKSVYIWGAQLEAASYPTSYIPTVASTVTRNADVISKTGISSLIGTTYTIYGEIINEGIHNARHLVLKLPIGGNYDDVVFIVQYFNGLQATANNSTSTAQFTINSGSYSIGQTLKYALRCEQNNVAFYINGVQIGVDTLCTISAVSTLYIGNYVDLQLGSKIKSTMIFPSALTNTELAQLTTL